MRTEKWLPWESVSVSQRISHKENQSSKSQDFSEIKPHLSSWWIQLSGWGIFNVNKVGSVVIGFEKKMPLILQFCTKKCKYMEYWKSNKVFKSSNILHKCQYSHYWEYNLSDFFTLLHTFLCTQIKPCVQFRKVNDGATLRVVSNPTIQNPMGKVFRSSNTTNFFASSSNKIKVLRWKLKKISKRSLL